MAQGVAARVSWKHVHPRVATCLSVCFLSLFWPLPLSCVSLPLVHSLHLLHPGHHPPCGGNRRAPNPLRTRRMRSIAPWRYTTLSHIESSQKLSWRPALDVQMDGVRKMPKKSVEKTTLMIINELDGFLHSLHTRRSENCWNLSCIITGSSTTKNYTAGSLKNAQFALCVPFSVTWCQGVENRVSDAEPALLKVWARRQTSWMMEA